MEIITAGRSILAESRLLCVEPWLIILLLPCDRLLVYFFLPNENVFSPFIENFTLMLHKISRKLTSSPYDCNKRHKTEYKEVK